MATHKKDRKVHRQHYACLCVEPSSVLMNVDRFVLFTCLSLPPLFVLFMDLQIAICVSGPPRTLSVSSVCIVLCSVKLLLLS